MEIGKKLRTLRAEKGYTQEKLADLLKMPQAAYSNLENNKGKLDLNLIEKIAAIYEMDILDILKEESLSITNKKNKGGNNAFLIVNQLSDKLIEQYEACIVEKDEIIKELKQTIQKMKV